MAKVTKGIRCTLNPSSEHFCYDWVKPYLDDDGFPIKELSGKTRYFLIVNDELYTDWDYDTLYEKFYDPNLDDDKQKIPDTYTYIPSTLEDNEVLNTLDPSYRTVLDSLPEKKRKQLLFGCWSKDESSGMLFQRSWLNRISKENLPKTMNICRAWDLAGQPPTDDNKFPDFTYGLLVGKCSQGFYYILNGTKFQDRPGARNQRIINQAKADNNIWGEVTVVTAIDPGSAGKEAYQAFAAQLTSERIKCKPDPAPNNNSKFKKYEPFSDACQNGLVFICEDLWEKEELEYYYRMNELFDGVTRSTARRKDDCCDSSGAAFNFLDQKKVYKTLITPTINSPTAIANRDRPI